MKTKIQLCSITLILLLFVSCTIKNKNENVIDKNLILQEMIDEKIAEIYPNYALNINIDSLLLENKNTFEGLIYLLNADCSFCVGQFLDFIFYCCKKNIHLPLITIIEEGSTEAVKYYMKQVKLESIKNLTIIENHNKKIISESLDSYSGIVLYYKNGKLISSVLLNMEE